MKRIAKEELFTHVSGFLAKKGVELKEGSYSRRIHQGCGILADLVNMSQDGLESAKKTADEQLEKLRQVIHEKTAPKPGQASEAPPPPKTEPAPAAAAPDSKPAAAAKPKRTARKPAAKPAAKTTRKA